MGKLADAIFKMYIEAFTRVFDTIAGDGDKDNAESLVRFVIIGIAFGPDRALAAYKDLDDLSTPIGPPPERIEEIKRSFEKVVPIHHRRDVGLDNINYFETQYRLHYVRERGDPSISRDVCFIENTSGLFKMFLLLPGETKISS